MPNVAAYIRVSRKDQIEGFSLETQEQIVRDYCERQGWGAPVLYVEPGRSAFSEQIDKRPQFRRLLEDAEARAYSRIVCYQYDRFARWASVALAAHDRLKRARVRLVSVTEPFDPDTAFGKLQYTQMAGWAEFYSASLSERLKRVNEVRRSKGHKLGPLHFGARLNPETLREEVDPEKAAHLRRFLEVAAEHTQIETCIILNGEGIPTRLGKRWHSSTIHQVIKKAGWLLGQPEPWPTLYRAAALRRPAPPMKRTIPPRLLSGLLRCACGGALSIRQQTATRVNLTCINWERPEGSACTRGRRTNLAVYEAITIAFFFALPDLSRYRLEVADDDALAATIAGLREDRRRLGVRYDTRNIEDDEYFARLASIDARLREAEEAALGERVVVLHGIAGAQAAWRAGDLTIQAQNHILRLLFRQVTVDGKTARIELLPDVERALRRIGWTHRYLAEKR